MDNSFFEFRNETMDVSMRSTNDSDVIDNSLMEDESFTVYKKPSVSNHTKAVIAESEESSDGIQIILDVIN